MRVTMQPWVMRWSRHFAIAPISVSILDYSIALQGPGLGIRVEYRVWQCGSFCLSFGLEIGG